MLPHAFYPLAVIVVCSFGLRIGWDILPLAQDDLLPEFGVPVRAYGCGGWGVIMEVRSAVGQLSGGIQALSLGPSPGGK